MESEKWEFSKFAKNEKSVDYKVPTKVLCQAVRFDDFDQNGSFLGLQKLKHTKM